VRTGDRIRAINGQTTASEQAVRVALRQLRSGDTARVEIERAGATRTASVIMTPFDRPVVQLRDVVSPTAAQRELRTRWESGAP
jgi:hypothetical protein